MQDFPLYRSILYEGLEEGREAGWCEMLLD